MDQEQAFLKAFDEHADELYRHARFRVKEQEMAQDLVQDAFIKTWDYLVAGKNVEQFRPFLYRTLNNLIIDQYRKKGSQSLDALLESETITEGSFDELIVDGRDEVEQQFDGAELLLIMEEMPEQFRSLVVMRYVDGLLPQEIAEVTGESVNVVSVRIHRGVAWLKKWVVERDQKVAGRSLPKKEKK